MHFCRWFCTDDTEFSGSCQKTITHLIRQCILRSTVVFWKNCMKTNGRGVGALRKYPGTPHGTRNFRNGKISKSVDLMSICRISPCWQTTIMIRSKCWYCIIDDLHSSKGLEFPIVFIVGLEEPISFPVVVEFQVGIGRGTKTFLCRCYESWKKITTFVCDFAISLGTLNNCEPSRFLDELNPACLALDFKPRQTCCLSRKFSRRTNCMATKV